MQDKIDEVTEYFDFSKVLLAMKLLDWKWAGRKDGSPRVPDMQELKQTAKNLLQDCAEYGGTRGTGGFEAANHNGELSLKFVVAQWDTQP